MVPAVFVAGERVVVPASVAVRLPLLPSLLSALVVRVSVALLHVGVAGAVHPPLRSLLQGQRSPGLRLGTAAGT